MKKILSSLFLLLFFIPNIALANSDNIQEKSNTFEEQRNQSLVQFLKENPYIDAQSALNLFYENNPQYLQDTDEELNTGFEAVDYSRDSRPVYMKELSCVQFAKYTQPENDGTEKSVTRFITFYDGDRCSIDDVVISNDPYSYRGVTSTDYKTATSKKNIYVMHSNKLTAIQYVKATFGFDGRNVWAKSYSGWNESKWEGYTEIYKDVGTEYTDDNRNVLRVYNRSGFQHIQLPLALEGYDLRLSCNMQGKLFHNGDELY